MTQFPAWGRGAHSSVLPWRIPRTEEPGRFWSMRSQRVGHSLATNTFTSLSLIITEIEAFLGFLAPELLTHVSFLAFGFSFGILMFL